MSLQRPSQAEPVRLTLQELKLVCGGAETKNVVNSSKRGKGTGKGGHG
jgi:hypothetical protein